MRLYRLSFRWPLRAHTTSASLHTHRSTVTITHVCSTKSAVSAGGLSRIHTYACHRHVTAQQSYIRVQAVYTPSAPHTSPPAMPSARTANCHTALAAALLLPTHPTSFYPTAVSVRIHCVHRAYRDSATTQCPLHHTPRPLKDASAPLPADARTFLRDVVFSCPRGASSRRQCSSSHPAARYAAHAPSALGTCTVGSRPRAREGGMKETLVTHRVA